MSDEKKEEIEQQRDATDDNSDSNNKKDESDKTIKEKKRKSCPVTTNNNKSSTFRKRVKSIHNNNNATTWNTTTDNDLNDDSCSIATTINRMKTNDPVLRLHIPLLQTIPSIILPPYQKSQTAQSSSSSSSSSSSLSPSSSSSLLSQLLHPLPSSTFLKHLFRKKAVHIASKSSSSSKDRLRNIVKDERLYECDVLSLMKETSSDSIFLWLPSSSSSKLSSTTKTDNNNNNNNNDNNSTTKIQSIEISDPETAHLLNSNGEHPAYFRAPPLLEQTLVSQLLKDTGMGCGSYDPNGQSLTCLGRGEVEMFVGGGGGGGATASGRKRKQGSQRKNSNITGWHTDFQENFTVQLKGRKKWTLKMGTATHPLRGITPQYKCNPNNDNAAAAANNIVELQMKSVGLSNPNFKFYNNNNNNNNANKSTVGLEKDDHNNDGNDIDKNNIDNEEVVIMNPGDVLYFPAGMWHKVENISNEIDEIENEDDDYKVDNDNDNENHTNTTNNTSLSMNISLMGTTYAKLITQSLEHVLLKEERWREIICDTGLGDDCTTDSDDNDGINGDTVAGEAVVKKLGTLLKKYLPQVISHLGDNGFEKGMLPPTLRYPPTFDFGDDSDDDIHSGNDCISDDDSKDDKDHDSIKQIYIKENGNTKMNKDQDENESKYNNHTTNTVKNETTTLMTREDEVEDEEVINIGSFQSPILNWNCNRPSEHSKLVKNPLASLIRLEDVMGYSNLFHNNSNAATTTSSSSSSSDRRINNSSNSRQCSNDLNDDSRFNNNIINDKTNNVYILNVNFAGNEAHESAVRVLLRDEGNWLERFQQYEEKGLDTAIMTDSYDSKSLLDGSSNVPPSCLFYYGYCYWV